MRLVGFETRNFRCLVINLERYQLEGPQFSTKKINCSLEPSFELDISSLQKFPEIEKNGLEQSEKQQDSQYGQLLDRMKSCEIIKCCETKNIIMVRSMQWKVDFKCFLSGRET